MKNRFTKILGVVLTLAVLASMLVVATPASAGYMGWTKDSAPGLTTNKILGVDIVDLAVATNGTTGYAVGSDGKVYKTTDGGSTFAAAPATGLVGAVRKIALAPDVADGSLLFAIVGANGVWASDSGANAFVNVTGLLAATQLNYIAVSPAPTGTRTIAVTGNAGGSGAVWHYSIGSGLGGSTGWVNAFSDDAAAGWGAGTSGNVTEGTNALAVAFSPNYASDYTIYAITSDNVNTYANIGFTFQKRWNAAYQTFGPAWGTGKDIGGVNSVADIAIPASYSVYDPLARIVYLALNSADGLIRMTDTGVATLSATAVVSVALNGAGDKLVAGAAASNTVLRVASPATAAANSAVPPTPNKYPSFATSAATEVAYFGANVGAATYKASAVANDETAFALSANDGAAFNDVAFIDTVAAVTDFAVNADGTKYYLITEYNNVVSLWRKTTAWERVVKYTGSSYIIRPAADNFDVAYLVDQGGTTLLYSNDAFQTTVQTKGVWYTVNDMVAETASTVYVLTGTDVAKSADGGNSFPPADKKTTGAGVGNSIYLVSAGNLVVGADAGFAYSTDSGATWTKVAGGNVSNATADKLSAGGKVFAAVGTGVYAYTIGTDVMFPAAAKGTAAFTVNSMVMNSGLAYAMSNNTTDSSYVRSGVTGAWQTKAAAGTAFKLLKAASGGNIYTVNTIDNTIYVFTEIFAAAGPALVAPADNFITPINQETGNANNVVFQWTGIANADPVTTTYNLQIALDSNFTQVVCPVAGIGTPMVIVGPSGTTIFNFQADTTYYWRVRADAAFDSPWSTSRKFKIDTLAPVSMNSPSNGAMNVSLTPTFSWSPAPGATGYELVVSDDPTFAIITYSRTSTNPVFYSDEELAYSTVYYWKVRPTGASYPAAGTPYVMGIFTTMARPDETTTAPITITQTNPTITVSVPPANEVIPSYLLWIIIAIGAILVIALIVLIVRTRRVS